MDKKQLLQEGCREARYISAKDNKTYILNDYFVSRNGEVWSFRTSNPKILDGTFCHGYKMYSLYTTENGKNKTIIVYAHVLIASTFFDEVKINNIEDEKTFEQVHHIDHNKNNNSPSNLLWISKVEHDQLHSKSDITRKRMSENHADFSRENHPMFGKHHTDETRRKMSEAKTGENNPMRKPVIASTDSGSYYKEFAGARVAERELSKMGIKVHQQHICKCCKGKLKSAGKIIVSGKKEKLRWKYKEP